MTRILIKPPTMPSSSMELDRDRFMIGRLPENDISIPDKSVSRVHARLDRDGDSYRISDQGSRNGVLVNDRRIAEPTLLRTSDRILLGDVEIEVQAAHSSQNVMLSDSSFEMNPGATMILRHDQLPPDLSLALAADEETREQERTVDPAKLMAFFEEVTHAVIEQRPFEEVLAEIVRHSLDIIGGADRACLILRENGELAPRVARQRDGRRVQMEVSSTVVERVVETRDSVLSCNAQDDQLLAAAESVVIQGIRSVMCVPLVSDDEVLGVLYVDSHSPIQRFTPVDLKIFSALGNIAAGHIMRQRLLAENIQQRVLEEQMRAASATQRRLLQVDLPEIEGYEFQLDNRPCLEVGGDYVDLLQCDGKLLLVLGDVCGKGIAAALLMATLQAGVHAQAQASTNVLDITRRVNAYLHQRTAPEKFVTLFLACLDPATGHLQYVNAGHDPPMIARRGQPQAERLASTGLLVGAVDASIYQAEVAETTLEPGDLLVVFTDGLHEPESPSGEAFGEERLIQFILDHRDLDTEELACVTVEEVLRFAVGHEQQDDMTQLIVKRLDPSAGPTSKAIG